MAFRTLATAALLASAAMARTDLVGCTSYATVATQRGGGVYATVIWYVPDTGELCDFLDCGGGRAPPKTTVPGCAAYSGTETYSPSFINPATLGGHAPAKTTSAIAASSTHVGDETSLKTSITSGAKETASASKSSSDDDEDSSTITVKATDGTATATASASVSDIPALQSASESKGTNTASGSKETASATTSSAKADATGAAAAVHGGAVFGTCLVAGAAACLALL